VIWLKILRKIWPNFSINISKSTAWLTYLQTYLALSTIYMFFSDFPVCLFSYTVLCELRLFIVSKFGFWVWNSTTAPTALEYLPILLGKYTGIYFLGLPGYLWFLCKYPGIYFAPKYKPFYLLGYCFYVNPSYIRIFLLYLFPVKYVKLSTCVNAQRFLSCYC